ncbi:hypothetical protein RIEGSTA812A_PEG_487 [invertebrate metagenome]|uniref:Uncharacterized protein n=1 Tax=invertebrate metagenome TaxID=1711999 RepID=A0A484H668_9ZZZZ
MHTAEDCSILLNSLAILYQSFDWYTDTFTRHTMFEDIVSA